MSDADEIAILLRDIDEAVFLLLKASRLLIPEQGVASADCRKAAAEVNAFVARLNARTFIVQQGHGEPVSGPAEFRIVTNSAAAATDRISMRVVPWDAPPHPEPRR